jgi:hypothetical protein
LKDSRKKIEIIKEEKGVKYRDRKRQTIEMQTIEIREKKVRENEKGKRNINGDKQGNRVRRNL